MLESSVCWFVGEMLGLKLLPQFSPHLNETCYTRSHMNSLDVHYPELCPFFFLCGFSSHPNDFYAPTNCVRGHIDLQTSVCTSVGTKILCAQLLLH